METLTKMYIKYSCKLHCLIHSENTKSLLTFRPKHPLHLQALFYSVTYPKYLFSEKRNITNLILSNDTE